MDYTTIVNHSAARLPGETRFSDAVYETDSDELPAVEEFDSGRDDIRTQCEQPADDNAAAVDIPTRPDEPAVGPAASEGPAPRLRWWGFIPYFWPGKV